MKKDENDDANKEPKFKIVDRRRINPDEIEAADEVIEPVIEPEPVQPEGPEVQDAEPELEISEPSDEQPEEEDKTPGEEVKPDEDPLVFLNITLSFLQTLATVVWVRLGLVAHPQTNLIAKNMEEARKMIDMYEVLLNMASVDIPDQIEAELNRALQDIKANYVNQL